MPFSSQYLECSRGDSFAFEIDMSGPVGAEPNLSGATAEWRLYESWIDGARLFITKTTGAGIDIAQVDGVWTIVVTLDPADTANPEIPTGILYHEARVSLIGGFVSHVTTGQFNLIPSRNV